MDYILQKENGEEDIDVRILREQLDKEPFTHHYTYAALDEVRDLKDSGPFTDGKIPVGTIDFVGAFLRQVCGTDTMNPIEVPEALRSPVFLHRSYKILSREQVPEKGHFFVKECSVLKGFLDMGIRDISVFRDKLPEGFYVVSDLLDILSEYRIFVIRDHIVSVTNYNGSPQLLPDMSCVRAMTGCYLKDSAKPWSYTLDVAVTKRGTCILEVHPWACIGLYGYLWGSDLAYAYADGFEWYLKHNTPVMATA